MLHLKIGLACSLALTIGLKAGPLHWGKVSDDAKWVAHVDFEGLRQTSVYQKLNDLFLKEPIAAMEKKIEEETGMKIPFDGLQSFTAFGKTASQAPDVEGVLMLEMSPDLKKTAENWLVAVPKQGIPHLPITIQAVEAEIEGLFTIEDEIMMAFDTDSNYLCIARSKDRLIQSIQQLGNDANPGEIKKQFKIHTIPKGTLAYVAVVNAFEGAPLPPQQAKVLEMSKGASFSIGESGKNIFMKLLLHTKEAGDSLQIQRILSGIQALAMLNAKQPEWFPILQAIDIRHQAEQVRVNWTMTLQNATKLIHALQGSKQ